MGRSTAEDGGTGLRALVEPILSSVVPKNARAMARSFRLAKLGDRAKGPVPPLLARLARLCRIPSRGSMAISGRDGLLWCEKGSSGGVREACKAHCQEKRKNRTSRPPQGQRAHETWTA